MSIHKGNLDRMIDWHKAYTRCLEAMRDGNYTKYRMNYELLESKESR